MPTVIIIFGISGDLASRKLIPALHELYNNYELTDNDFLMGFGRKYMGPDDFVKYIDAGYKEGVVNLSASSSLGFDCEDLRYMKEQNIRQNDSVNIAKAESSFIKRPDEVISLYKRVHLKSGLSYLSHYIVSDYNNPGGYKDLQDMIESMYSLYMSKKVDETLQIVIYLSLPPYTFELVVSMIKKYLKFTKISNYNIKICIEKPLGRDLTTYKTLQADVLEKLERDEYYLVDHYSQKIGIRGLLWLKLTNPILDRLISDKYIKHVYCTLLEDLDVEGRGSYFDEYGIIRDVFQNHMLQMITYSCVSVKDLRSKLKATQTLKLDEISDLYELLCEKKIAFLRTLQSIDPSNVIIGQYKGSTYGIGYCEDSTVADKSTTETYALIQTKSNRAPWKDIPFIFECGKGLNKKISAISFGLRRDITERYPDYARLSLIVELSPRTKIYFLFTKDTGEVLVDEDLKLSTTFLQEEQNVEQNMCVTDGILSLELPTELIITRLHLSDYARVFLSAINGDGTYFVDPAEVHRAWEICEDMFKTMSKGGIPLLEYPRNTERPVKSVQILNNFQITSLNS